MAKVKSVSSAKRVSPYDARFVPSKEAVMSEAVLAQVFESEPLPFKVRADGSVSLGAYMEWLDGAGAKALEAFGEHSEVIRPRRAVLMS